MNPNQMKGQVAKKMAKKMAPGGGGRFQALEGKLAHQPGVTNPAGLAAYIGKKKYGTGPKSPFGQ